MFVRCQQTAKRQAARRSSSERCLCLCSLPLPLPAASAYAWCLWSLPMLGTYAHWVCICLCLCPLYSANTSAPAHASACCLFLCSLPMLPASTRCLYSLPLLAKSAYASGSASTSFASTSAHCLCLCLLPLASASCLYSLPLPSPLPSALCPASASAFNFSFFASYVMFFDCILIAATFPFRAFPPLMDIAHTQRATVHLCRPSHSLASSLHRLAVQLFTLI